MKIRSLTSPIGSFESIYIDSVLTRLVFLDNKDSIHPADISLQSFINEFFSINKLQKSPKFNLQGSPFQLKVWKALMKIPKGQTESYGSLAIKIGVPGAARAVGTACKMNPIPLFIPCHRVVRHDDSIGEFALGKKNKEFLLKMESK